MTRLRLAHFSDLHLTIDPFSSPRESLRGKRIASLFSYVFGGRRERFMGSAKRIEALLADVDAMGVDHAICTGDLTASSLDEELEAVAAIFGSRLSEPERFTVLPGNHDRYVERAVAARSFERRFGAVCPAEPGAFPFVKSLGNGVRIVAIDTARPTSFLDSSGLCGDRQREALRAALAENPESVTIVAMHYGLIRWNGDADREHHRLRDFAEVLEILDTSPARIALVLHGHMHGAFTVSHGRSTILCSGSATDLLVDCGYFVYDLDLETLELAIERRHWNRHEGRFERVDCAAFELAVRERRGERLARQRPLV